MMHLTIGIPTYNNPEGLRAELACLYEQLNADVSLRDTVEVLVSDNSDNEATSDVTASFRGKFTHFTYIKNGTNLGYDKNVDQVLTRAQGAFCWTLSDNDLIAPGGVAAVMNVILKYPTVAHILIQKETAPEADILQFENTEAMLRVGGYRSVDGGLVSQNVFNRLLLPHDRSRYYGNYWFHLSIALAVGGKHPIIRMPGVFVEKPTEDICRWAKNGVTFLTYTNLYAIMMNLGEFGYSQEMLDVYHRSFMKGMPHQVVTGKLYGLRVNAETVRRLYTATKKEPFLFMFCVALLVLPAGLFKMIKYVTTIWKK